MVAWYPPPNRKRQNMKKKKRLRWSRILFSGRPWLTDHFFIFFYDRRRYGNHIRTVVAGGASNNYVTVDWN